MADAEPQLELEDGVFEPLPDIAEGVAEAEVVSEAEADAGQADGSAGEHIALDGAEPLDEWQGSRPQWRRRSGELMAHARSERALKKARRDAEAAGAQALQGQQATSALAAVVPSVARWIGAKPHHVGRVSRDRLRPEHFAMLCRGVFYPASSEARLGINLKRLHAAGVQVLKHRQEAQLDSLLTSARDAVLSCSSEVRERQIVHVTHMHMWDEVNARFRWHSARHRSSKMQTALQCCVQRGAIRVTLGDLVGKRFRAFVEPWVVLPMEVQGTSAAATWPAVLKGMPQSLWITSKAMMVRLLTQVSSFCQTVTCDKAASNLSLLRVLGHSWETEVLDMSGGRILFMPETCCVHMHHRMKHQIVPLRWHVSRLFSLAHLVRLKGVRSSIYGFIERQVPLRVRRVRGPPPEGLQCTMATFVRILFGKAADLGLGKGRGAQRAADLASLVQMLNGDLRGEWVHHCFDHATERPCCASLDECHVKVTSALIHCLFAVADPIPSESRWTHTLAKAKAVLLRWA
jgi:hypothetical protein